MTKRNIILDCDPGHDDAIALLLSCYSDELNLLAVTTSAGNQTIDKTSRNALNLLNFFNKSDIPLAKGSSHPLVRKIQTCPEIHGESGLDGFTFPLYKENYDFREGYQLIIDTLLHNEDVTVVTTGPMTNLALAISHNKRILKNIKEIVLMGGSTGEGNITKAAEFNILVDPEAADICFRSGVPLRMLGLNVTRQILVTDEVVKEASKIPTRGADLFVKLMKVFNENQRSFFGLEAGPLHDPATIVFLINEDVFEFEDMNVEIDVSQSELAGKTVCSKDKLPHNVKVATTVNVDLYWKEIFKHLRRCK